MEYKMCYVAFIDILGFKKCVEKKDFEVVHRALLNMKTEEMADPSILSLKYGVHGLKILCVSDSVIMSIEKDQKNSLEALVWMCAAFQTTLLLNDHMLMRGAITCGDFYMNMEDGVLFGPAYVKAVEIEHNSVLPRVVIDESVDASKATDKQYLAQDKNDGKFFVDYMAMATRTACVSYKLERVSKFILDSLHEFKHENEYQKYAWQKDYYNDALRNSRGLSSYIISWEDTTDGQA